ncbi:hypothetical protein [uncultured Flavobacterium sp.]|uniref:hypothetical protein n=1 Tax=uncultured Flavobacterium sp. TaxID=165435 RepID=UPI0025D8C30B|nr:hypothetical protein [uncultured Flavobacterium sp.]
MKRFDSRHIAFHILVALYFIWAFVFAALLAMAMSNAVEPRIAPLSEILPMWILMNLAMGSALFLVIRLFRSKEVIIKTVRLSYIVLASGSIAVMAFMAVKA